MLHYPRLRKGLPPSPPGLQLSRPGRNHIRCHHTNLVMPWCRKPLKHVRVVAAHWSQHRSRSVATTSQCYSLCSAVTRSRPAVSIIAFPLFLLSSITGRTQFVIPFFSSVFLFSIKPQCGVTASCHQDLESPPLVLEGDPAQTHNGTPFPPVVAK